MARQTDGRTLQTTRRSMQLLRTLIDLDGARVTTLASELDMAPSTVYTHLSTLVDEELVTKEGDVYHVGLAFINFGDYARTRTEAYRLAETYTEDVANESGYRGAFVVEEHGRGVFVHVSASEQTAWSHASAGSRGHLHSIAAGKAILAYMPWQNVEEIVEKRGLPSRTENTITSQDALREELEEVRDREYAFNFEENVEGIRAVAVPVRDASGQVLGAFSVSGPANRFTDEQLTEELPNLLLGIANEFELELSLS